MFWSTLESVLFTMHVTLSTITLSTMPFAVKFWVFFVAVNLNWDVGLACFLLHNAHHSIISISGIILYRNVLYFIFSPALLWHCMLVVKKGILPLKVLLQQSQWTVGRLASVLLTVVKIMHWERETFKINAAITFYIVITVAGWIYLCFSLSSI